MFLNTRRRCAVQRIVLAMTMFILGMTGASSGWPQQSTPAGGAGIVWQICAPPPVCFASRQAKQTWAEQNQCRFLEDVCEKTPPEQDNKGAQSEDEGLWGSLWGGIKQGLVYGYEFVKGLLAGLSSQVSDLLKLVTDIDEVVGGLIDLGKAFYNDPKGTLAALAELLGQEAVDTITRATQCGAYDLGKVIGAQVSPAVMLKLAGKLTRYGGNLAEAVKATRHDLGCASFAAGTPVMTPQGPVPIERIVAGQQVLSRDERGFADAPQTVTQTFGRTAPAYRLLRTEFETLALTDEHPLWVQGKGWTEARDVADEDVIATWNGDALVTGNEAVDRPLRVYNFSVAKTPSYFVGNGGAWVHNAKCGIELYTKAWDKLTPKEKGFRAERDIFVELNGKGYEPVGKSFDPRGKSPDDSFKAWDGQTGIDGIYKDKNGNYVIVESKATGGAKAGDPEGCVAKLCKLTDGQRQMSTEWIEKNLEKLVPDPVERQKILDGIDKKDGSVKKVYAQTDANGTTYHEINDAGNKDVKIGKPWNP